jgi:uncharacterized membrane protein
MSKLTTKKLVLTALFTALITIATLFIRIPLPLGYVNLGDAFIFISIFILGPVLGTFSAGIGSAIADLIGYITYAPGTLIIKALMAIVAYLIYTAIFKATKKTILSEIIAGIVGALIMAFGYFVYESLFFVSVAVAIINVPYNIVQGLVGVVIAVIIMRILTSTKVLDKLQK